MTCPSGVSQRSVVRAELRSRARPAPLLYFVLKSKINLAAENRQEGLRAEHLPNRADLEIAQSVITLTELED